MDKIDLETKKGVYLIQTISKSRYILKITNNKITIKRSPQNEELSLRKDNSEIEVLDFLPIIVGECAKLKLKPLGDGESTYRITTKVTGISRIRDI